ncbi:cation transporter [Candidatus Woesearchaeota archaeon]|nr:cation transporter [Candidatus Woesearchaeota archaeon]
MPAKKIWVVIVALIANFLLFILKLIFGILFNSIALLSEAVNSFLDLFSTSTVLYCMKISGKKPDKGHPFGHHGAEPIASLIVATMIAVLGFNVLSKTMMRFISGETIIRSYIPAVIALIVIFTKIILFLMTYFANKENNIALKAMAYDHKNDILISLFVLVGLILASKGLLIFDNIAAIFLGLWIIYSSLILGRESVKYLMGEAPDKQFLDQAKKTILKVRGIKGFHDLRAHFVGTVIHIEVHIEMDKKLNFKKSHSIGKEVQKKLESLKDVGYAFIHIDPV